MTQCKVSTRLSEYMSAWQRPTITWCTHEGSVLLVRAARRALAVAEDDAVVGTVLQVLLLAVDQVLVDDVIDDLQLRVRAVLLCDTHTHMYIQT